VTAQLSPSDLALTHTSNATLSHDAYLSALQ
jgi:hypothetical protein